jgi:hypothetical protein
MTYAGCEATTAENKRIGGYVAKESGAVPEVVAPLADAVRFVNGKQRYAEFLIANEQEYEHARRNEQSWR